ncbi:hypothetical protein HMPREF3206_01662 [Fusobacterium equinum]|uniref:Uncharacterized protein n=1 Tax=Fusobacterium equinum TaxID=134605 RepID=A0A133N9A0_9FUSO|nr:hypothetical protein HMPREF3206_01662 [Fusobacterium equinum]
MFGSLFEWAWKSLFLFFGSGFNTAHFRSICTKNIFLNTDKKNEKIKEIKKSLHRLRLHSDEFGTILL